MTGKEALRIIFQYIKSEPVVCATGYICRSVQAVAHRPENFYMIGSMGMASSIALGAARAVPRRKIIALDGDGAVLMNLGTLPTVGALKTSNFVHLVLDNACYESTGSQPSFTRSIGLERIAAASGYRSAKRVANEGALRREMKSILSKPGPSFLLIPVTRDASAEPRVQASPEEITRRFSRCLR